MPKDKSESHVRIVFAAKKEFLEKGFEKASMRSIADLAGMTSAGLYRHFADKEDMFAALVDPVLKKCKSKFNEHKLKDYELLKHEKLDDMWGTGSDLEVFLQLIYCHFEEFKLLVCCSQGTKYSDIIHQCVEIEQKETLAFLDVARKQGMPVKDIKPEELHLLLSAYIAAIFEVVIHDFTLEDAKHYLKTLQTFFYPGWRAVLGL